MLCGKCTANKTIHEYPSYKMHTSVLVLDCCCCTEYVFSQQLLGPKSGWLSAFWELYKLVAANSLLLCWSLSRVIYDRLLTRNSAGYMAECASWYSSASAGEWAISLRFLLKQWRTQNNLICWHVHLNDVASRLTGCNKLVACIPIRPLWSQTFLSKSFEQVFFLSSTSGGMSHWGMPYTRTNGTRYAGNML